MGSSIDRVNVVAGLVREANDPSRGGDRIKSIDVDFEFKEDAAGDYQELCPIVKIEYYDKTPCTKGINRGG